MSDPSAILDSLNPIQRAAAEQIDGALLVLAGAGSGKTRVITHRIAFMIASGISPHEILAVTFTNKAAREMRERVRALTGRSEVRLTTFHSFCASFLREEFPTIGRESGFTIYDDADSKVLVKNILVALDIDPDLPDHQRISHRIGRWKNDLTFPDRALALADTTAEELAARVYARYQAALVEANACDFDDLLLQTFTLLRDHEDILRRWRARISHVLVDEYQDTNGVQYELVRTLTKASHNLCITGDPDQSIYSWRGVDARNFDRFLEDYPDAKVVPLEQNYRSTRHILKAASDLIAHNRHRIPKTLWTNLSGGEPVRVVGFRDDYEEARSIASAIREFETEGYDRSQMAVFYRTNALSLPIERMFVQQQIPYQVVGGLEFFARQEVKDLMAWLRFLSNPRDVLSGTRILNVPPRGIGNVTRDRVLAQARESGRPLGEVLRDPSTFTELSARARRALDDFANLLRQLDEVRRDRIQPLIETVLEATKYAAHWAERSLKNGSLDPYQNLGQVISLAADFDRTRDSNLEEFLAEIALLTDLDRWDPQDARVSLMTLHSSKGLEFDVVFLAGAEENLIPHVMCKDSMEGIDEERRLLHVGMTRAKRRLVLTHVEWRTRFGRASPCRPSSFLEEFGPDGVERFGAVGTPAKEEQEAAGDWDLEDHPLARLRAGARVWHPDWGSGVVKAFRGRGRGPDGKVIVRFDDSTERTLVVRHARLEIMED